MAFFDYSSLFTSGLLSEDASASFASMPWATEYLGPRRGSLPGSVESLPLQPPPSSSSVPDANESIASGESFYFTFKKRRNTSEYRSFLSLDLAESQSLRSASLKAKESHEALSLRARRAVTAYFTATTYPSFTAVYSPPPPSSPRSPTSPHSLHDPDLPEAPVGLTVPLERPHSSTSSTHSQPDSPSFLPSRGRSLSPMRFASPPPTPPLTAHFDASSMTSAASSGILSRASTVSSGYRRAKRVDALKRLEGRGADGALGRIIPRISQNFMSMSDDETEDEDIFPHAGIDVIVEDVIMEDEQRDRMSRHSGRSQRSRASQASRSRGLSVMIDNDPWFHVTPRASAWGIFLGGEADEDEKAGSSKLTPIDTSSRPSVSHHSSDSRGSPKSKRSKHSNSPRTTDQKRIPSPTTSARSSELPEHIHPLSSSSSSSSASHSLSRSHSLTSSRSKSSASSRARPTSNTDSSSKRPSRPSRLPARLDLRLDWTSSPAEAPNFIDLRDENFETDSRSDSRSDSWRSIFEVSCNA